MTKRAIHYDRKKYVRRDPPYQRTAGHELTKRVHLLLWISSMKKAARLLEERSLPAIEMTPGRLRYLSRRDVLLFGAGSSAR